MGMVTEVFANRREVVDWFDSMGLNLSCWTYARKKKQFCCVQSSGAENDFF